MRLLSAKSLHKLEEAFRGLPQITRRLLDREASGFVGAPLGK